MKEKLYQICEEILESEEKTKKFLSYETLDEVYAYFLKKLPGLTKDEFEDFICELLDNYAKEQEHIDKIKRESLGSVSGGVFGVRTKIASGVLALISMFPAAGAANLKKAEVGSGTVQSVNVSKPAEKVSLSGFQKIKAWVKAHPGLTAGLSIAAIALLAAGGTYAYKRWKNSKVPENESQKAGGISDIKAEQVGANAKVKTEAKSVESELIEYAKSGKSADLEKFLSEHKDIDLNFRGKSGKTAIMHAVEAGNADAVTFLLSKGADLNIQDNNKKTVLMYSIEIASENGKMEILDRLLGSNINLDVTGPNGDNILILATKLNNSDVIKKVFNRCKSIDGFVNREENNGEGPLIIAARAGNYEIVKLFLDNGAYASVANKKGETALICAAKGGYADVVKLLIRDEEGYSRDNLDNQDNEGNTALIYAASNGNIDVVNALFGAIRKNLQNNKGDTALICAARNGHIEVVNKLLSWGAGTKTDLKNEQGETALICAARGGHKEIVEKLWGHKDVHNEVGEAFVEAARNNHGDVVNYLWTKGQKNIGAEHKKLVLQTQIGDEVKIPIQKSLLTEKLNDSIKTWSKTYLGLGTWNKNQVYEFAVRLLNEECSETKNNNTYYNYLDNIGFRSNGTIQYQTEFDEFNKILEEFKNNWVSCKP